MARRPKGYRYASTATDSHAKVQLSGPLFEPQADATLRQNIRQMIGAVAAEGEANVKARSPRKSGDLAGGIVGRVRSERGKQWALTGVISATHVYPWKNKGARGYTGRAEAEYRGGKAEKRYRMFAATASQMRAARAIMAANLTKGLE
jgi:hypothetical protein